MKVLIVGRKFDQVAGGVERMAIQLAHAMLARGHDAALLTWDRESAKTYYPLDALVEWAKVNIGNPQVRASWKVRVQRQFRIRKIVKTISPDVIVGFQHGAYIATRLAVIGLGIPVIAAERNAPHRFEHLPAGRYRKLIYLSFLVAARVSLQFDSYRKMYPRYLQRRLVVIPNPISLAKATADPGGRQGETKVLLFVGHLSYQKNPKVLIKAFALLADEFWDWNLWLVGKGEERESLEALIAKLGYADRTRFIGNVADVEKVYLKANLFCLPSRFEGFPNALAEALAHGLPAVGFSECAGINELIKPGNNGLLASGNSDPKHLADSLRKLMASPILRANMGSKAIESVVGYYPDKVYEHWERLLSQTVKKRLF